MDSNSIGRLIIGITITALVVLFACYFLFKRQINAFFAYIKDKMFKNKLSINTKFIAKTGIFSALSIILYTVPFLKFGLPIFPAFLEIHLDEVPAFIAGFAYGPLCGFFVILIKTIVKLPLSSTMMVGELADFIYSIAFVVPAAVIYKKHKNIKGALFGLGSATIIQLIVSCFFTTFVMLNFYIFMMGLSENAILGMGQAVNPNVTSLGMVFLFFVALPFNAIKDAIVIVITMLLYKRLHTLIDRIANRS